MRSRSVGNVSFSQWSACTMRIAGWAAQYSLLDAVRLSSIVK